MYSLKEINYEQAKFEYERDSRSIFSIPLENKTIRIINSITAEILDSDFISDFKENFTSNYEKETLLDKVYHDYFREIEMNLNTKSFYEAFCKLNAIFFLLEYFPGWIKESENNQHESFFSDICFYFNNLIISFLSYAHFEKENNKAKEIGINIQRLIEEIQNYSAYLKENFNITAISAFSLDDYKTLETFDIDSLIKILRDLEEARLEEEGICFRYKEYLTEKLIYYPSNSLKINLDFGNHFHNKF